MKKAVEMGTKQIPAVVDNLWRKDLWFKWMNEFPTIVADLRWRLNNALCKVQLQFVVNTTETDGCMERKEAKLFVNLPIKESLKHYQFPQ